MRALAGRLTPILALGLLAPVWFGGCMDDGAGGDNASYKTNHGIAEIYVDMPQGVDDYPISSLRAVPRLVAWIAGDNATKAYYEAGGQEGYTDLAGGWEGWEGSNDGLTWPSAAVRDWMQPTGLWYRGQVPAGTYSVVRIEVLAVHLVLDDGSEPYAEVQGGRMSVGPDAGYFTVTDHKTSTFRFQARLEYQDSGTFVIH